MRPKKTRWIECAPGERCFRPKSVSDKKSETVNLMIDEFEAMRLIDLNGYDQTRAAKIMKIHRSTISRILSSARAKIADALVNIKTITIEGGCCRIQQRSRSPR